MKELVSINPYTHQTVATYSQHTAAEVDAIIEQSQILFSKWKQTALEERKELFISLAKQIRNHKNELAQLATDEMGKPYLQAVAELEKCAVTSEYYANHGKEFLADKEIKTESQLSFVTYQPLGTVLGIMPWNFPFWQAFRFAIPTIMAGNTVLLKHASNVSGCSLKIQELFEKAGFPKGVFQSLFMSSDRMEEVIASEIIKGVSLTGSTEAGKSVASLAGKYLKKQVLELGGSDPYLVLADADIKLASQTAMTSRLQNNGQSCIAAKRFIVLDQVYEAFKKQIIKHAEEVIMGDPNKKETDLGPLARKDLKEDLNKQVKKAIESGAQVTYQGKLNESDAFYPVTILENINKNNPAYVQEFFGPVILLFKVKTIEEGVKIANDTSFGLGSAIFSKNEDQAKELAVKYLNAGSCFVNSMVKSNPKLPFGGINESGYGRELSGFGILEFTNTKTISVN